MKNFTKQKANVSQSIWMLPVLTLSHNFAFKNFLGSKYSYNHTEFGIQKRFWFSAFGYFNAIVKAGKVWDKVPFPMLILPNANLSYTIQPESYALIKMLSNLSTTSMCRGILLIMQTELCSIVSLC